MVYFARTVGVFCTFSDRCGRATRQGGALVRNGLTKAEGLASPFEADKNEGGFSSHGERRFDETAARSRSSFRPPDSPLGSSDEALPLHRAQRHPHHRSPADRQ